MPSIRPLMLCLLVLTGRALAQEPFEKGGAAFLSKHCTSCHGTEKKKADLALHEFKSATSLLKARKKWKQILEMVTEGEMPPENKPQPSDSERKAFLASAKAVFANYDLTAKPDPGRVTIRRLNRNEYDNTIRDMLGVDMKPASDFPADGVGYGFDNIGDVLSISPLLMERFLDAAQTVAEKAIPLEPAKPTVTHVKAQQLAPSKEPIAMRGNWRELVDGAFPLHIPFKTDPTGKYVVRVQVWTDAPPTQQVELGFLVSGTDVANPEPPTRVAELEAAPQLQNNRIRILNRVEIHARKEDKPEVLEAKLTGISGVEQIGIGLVKGTGPARKVFVQYLEVSGPEDVRTPFMRRWGTASPEKTPGQRTRLMLGYFMPRAWHRPVTHEEVERVARVSDGAIARGDSWEASMRMALVAVLASPKFIFRMELDDQPTNTDPHPLNEFQLATRLSYFLWSSCPDDELLGYALSNQLTANLDKQVRRMLADPRAETLVDNFAMQWLQLRRLSNHHADQGTFKKWCPSLRDSMLTETRLFMVEIIRQDRPITELLDADFTYLDRRLAEIYNIWPPGGFEGDKFRRVSLAGGERGGLLTQASVLTVTSNPTRTSPVKRGKWILEQILGEPPPAPPPTVPSLDDESRKELSGSFRQKLEQHRADPKCANCHAKMDAMGFALENFDGIGQWRDKDELGQPVDVGGKLPKGGELKSLAELKTLLRTEQDQFATCLTEKMLTYALGRGLEYYDDRAVEKIRAELSKNGYKFSVLAIAIAKSDPFRLRRGKSQGDTP